MDALTFLNELYNDAAGFLTIWTKDKRTTWFQLPAQIEEAAAFEYPGDIYFGVGLGGERRGGRLTADLVTTIPGIWMDVDLATEQRPNLPKTTEDCAGLFPVQPTIIVHSGSGLHCYWLFREPWDITTERKQAADLLAGFQSTVRAAATAKGWHLDSTHDLARILRLPGTKNYKTDPPTPVRVICSDGPRYNQDDLDQFTATSGPRADRADKFHRNPSDGPSALVIENCKFIQVCRDYAAEISEPQWVAMISNIARCADGPEMCHELSRPYPRYSEKETDAKISHALNNMHPQSCQYIQNVLGFNQCTECGVKAPVAWALKKSRRQENPIPDDFWNPKPDEPELSKFTDLGNAEYFARYYDGRVRHCSEMDKWLTWDGKRWNIDGSNQITVLAGKCVRSMYDFLSGIDDDAARKQLFKHAMKSEDANKLAAMVKLAKGMMSVSVDTLDQNPWILNSPSGIIDLQTGELLPHDPDRNMTKMISATYDPAATCPTFEKFIDSTFESNQNVIGFMRRFLGYCLTGDTREQQFVIAWGSMGRNGKGTLLNLISDILQDYAKATPTDVLYAKKFDKPSNDIARLAGARFVLASEGERGKRLDEPLVKKMTGQDILAARFLYKETFEFMPQFKLVMMTNEKPTASEDDAALWARIQLVPFNRRFDGENQDKHLKQKLRNPREISGILNWLIAGCLEWQQAGLNPPEEVLHATREYRDENDKLKDWIEECCDVRLDLISSPKDLYRSFQAWSLANGEKFIMIYKNFVKSLEKRGHQQFTGHAGYKKMRGIAVFARDSTREEPY
jgi:P4 family phage/plasmid primase-like protien